MLIGDLAVGKDFPMRVMAEIVDAALMPVAEVQRIAKHFVSLGANIVDVGMVAGESRPADAGTLISAVKQVVSVPVSIDTLDPDEIREAVAAGADIVLSGDAGNIEAIAPFAKDAVVVFIPTNQREGYFPKEILERVNLLETLVQQAKQLGFRGIIGDLILDPLNILESLAAFREFALRNLEVPLFVGISNVTELMDADSVGINALLARISSELGASILLATEKSDKVKGTVQEEVLASKMMFLAKKRGSVPKDLGLDLLFLKDKRNREEFYDKVVENSVPVMHVLDTNGNTLMDETGSFRIFVDRNEEVIVALHYASNDLSKPDRVIKGKSAESICFNLIKLGLVSRSDHAAYLGRELAKAEIALHTGKEYIQDGILFEKMSAL